MNAKTDRYSHMRQENFDKVYKNIGLSLDSTLEPITDRVYHKNENEKSNFYSEKKNRSKFLPQMYNQTKSVQSLSSGIK